MALSLSKMITYNPFNKGNSLFLACYYIIAIIFIFRYNLCVCVCVFVIALAWFLSMPFPLPLYFCFSVPNLFSQYVFEKGKIILYLC